MNKAVQNNGSSGAIYGLGIIGAIVYYITNADGVLDGIWGIIKSFVWPALLVYELFGSLGL